MLSSCLDSHPPQQQPRNWGAVIHWALMGRMHSDWETASGQPPPDSSLSLRQALTTYLLLWFCHHRNHRSHFSQTAAAAAAAKSLQSCPTLCDPIDGSPPGSPVPGILQARTLEWAVISFSTRTWNTQRWERGSLLPSVGGLLLTPNIVFQTFKDMLLGFSSFIIWEF